jgi:hypothetical protein
VNEYEIDNLTPHTTYEISVAAGNYKGFSEGTITTFLTSEEGMYTYVYIYTSKDCKANYCAQCEKIIVDCSSLFKARELRGYREYSELRV